jgi:uncharacterized protein YukE
MSNRVELDIVGRSMTDRLEVLRGQIADIGSDVQSRHALHKDLQAQLSELIVDFRGRADRMLCIGFGSYFQQQKDELEKTACELEKELRLIRQSLWKDDQTLREQMRKLQWEYETALRRKILLENNIRSDMDERR